MSHDEINGFEQAAAAAFPEPEPEPEPQQELEPQAAAEVPDSERFIVSDAFAREFVKAPFSFLAAYHPAWVVTDEETERPVFPLVPAARPAMQECLQQLADKYLPSIMAKWAENNKPALTLVLAMGALAYAKALQVQAARAAEPQEPSKRAPVVPIDGKEQPEPEPVPASYTFDSNNPVPAKESEPEPGA